MYDPREVPNAKSDMTGTVILRPTRDEWLLLLGEMVQITNEAVRRRATSLRDASKPDATVTEEDAAATTHGPHGKPDQ